MFSPEQAQGLAKLFTDALENEYKTTKRVLEAVPADQLDLKVGEKGRTARELMWHIATSEQWFAEGVSSGAFPVGEGEPEAPKTKQEILRFYETQVPAGIAKVRAMSPQDLAREINFFNIFNLPAVLYLNFWNVHSIHHRGQLSTYLRAMNAKVPSIYGGSADEPFQMPATAAS